ncbi:DivIVA domain-containing protein [Pseudodesulfovibrio sediminis]|uniref:Arabinan synthesis protein n=1 Tax=Pseudodesulfovibrio sediminis TaxID=2810563 RepID=A0ABM7P2K9_9BACT|nr:DivIVA domain-containing protein [Pseudodesulfovibrio sediminis]BCS87011.1 arabinan synthesis protein [Pseudodesulfovibrio sediminis]
MTVSKIDLLNKQFSRGVFGYSRVEVDQFMLELAEVLGDAADNQKNMQKKIKRMEKTLREFRQRDETLRDTLMSTQRMVDDLKVTASKEAQIILDEARVKADATVQKGHSRLAQIHEEIESLKRTRTQFEIQLKGLLNSHLEMLEMSDPERDKIEEMESKLKYLQKVD